MSRKEYLEQLLAGLNGGDITPHFVVARLIEMQIKDEEMAVQMLKQAKEDSREH